MTHADTVRAYWLAAEARDWWGFVHASLWEANTTAGFSGSAWAETVRARRGQLAERRQRGDGEDRGEEEETLGLHHGLSVQGFPVSTERL